MRFLKNIFAGIALAVALLAATPPAQAGLWAVNNSIVWFNSPNTLSQAVVSFCEDGNLAVDLDNEIYYSFTGCSTGTPAAVQIWPVLSVNVQGLTALLASKYDTPSGTALDYLKGNGTVGLFPTDLNSFTNGPGYITTTPLASYLTSATAASIYATQSALSSGLAGKFNTPGGTTGQYVRGDGSLATLPAPGSRTWSAPSRAIGACFQISATKDADFHYKVDIASGTLLSGTVTGTVTATSYTNSGCTTGAASEADGQASQGAALGVLSVSQIASVPLDGTLENGKWLKITTANTVGTPTFTIRAVQREIVQP